MATLTVTSLYLLRPPGLPPHALGQHRHARRRRAASRHHDIRRGELGVRGQPAEVRLADLARHPAGGATALTAPTITTTLITSTLATSNLTTSNLPTAAITSTLTPSLATVAPPLPLTSSTTAAAVTAP